METQIHYIADMTGKALVGLCEEGSRTERLTRAQGCFRNIEQYLDAECEDVRTHVKRFLVCDIEKDEAEKTSTTFSEAIESVFEAWGREQIILSERNVKLGGEVDN